MTVNPSEQWPSASDDVLLSLARGGDDDAYNQLWQRCVDSSRSYAAQFIGDAKAEDLVTQAFSDAYQGVMGGHAPHGSFRSYVNATIRAIGMEGTHSSDDASPVEAEPEEAQADAIAVAFFDLDPYQREALWRTEVEGASPQEIADTMGMRPAQAIALKVQARSQFTQSVADNGGAPIGGDDPNRPTTVHAMSQGPSAIGEALLMSVLGTSSKTWSNDDVHSFIGGVDGIIHQRGDSPFSAKGKVPAAVDQVPASDDAAYEEPLSWETDDTSDADDGDRIFAPLPGIAVPPLDSESDTGTVPDHLDDGDDVDEEPEADDAPVDDVDDDSDETDEGTWFDEYAEEQDSAATDADQEDDGPGVPVPPASLVGLSAGLAANSTPLWDAEALTSETEPEEETRHRKSRLRVIIPLIIVLAIVLFLLTYCLAPSVGLSLPNQTSTSSTTGTATPDASTATTASTTPSPSMVDTPSETQTPSPSILPTATPTVSETPTPEETTEAPAPSVDPQPSATSGPPPAPTTAPAAPPPPPPPPKLAVTSVDSGAMNVCSPQLSGTAKPGDALTVTGLTNSPIQIQVGSNGKWTTGRISMNAPGSTTVTVTGASGQSVSTTVTQAPAVNVVASSSGGYIVVTITGQPGATVSLLVDSVSLGQASLGGGQSTVNYPIPAGINPGSHVLSGQYVSGSCSGSYSLSFFQI